MERTIFITEARKRMELLGFDEKAIADFESGQGVNLTEYTLAKLPFEPKRVLEIFTTRKLTKQEKAQVQEFEAEYGALVFYAVKNHTTLGTMNTYFYVSAYPEEWENEHQILPEGGTYAYVFNEDMPDFSEIGYIEFKKGKDSCGNLCLTRIG